MGVVLIAFESESEQSAIEQLLTSRGHQVQKSANGLAALDSARREPPDAVVSDIVLPRMDGFALCRKWKQDERLQHIPFIFYTRRHDDPKYERFALELGAERFLSRSVAPDALATAVDELLANAPGKAARPAAAPQPPVMMATGAHRAAAPQPPVMMATGAHRAAAPQPPAVMMATGAHRAAAPQPPAVMMATGAHRAAAPQPPAAMMATGAHPAAAPQPPAVMMATGAHSARAITEANQKHLEALERAQLVQARLRVQVNELETINERLSASETRFRKIFEANPLPMWIADHETGGFIAVNEASLAFYGYSRAELLAMKSNALAVEAQAASSNIARHKRKNGEVATVALGTQEIDFDGRRADLVTAFDLTERASREADLQQQLTASRAIFASIADGVLILDAAGRVVDANPAYCRLSGYSREELLKLKAADIEDQSSGEHTLKFHMGRTSGSGRYESKHRRQDGTFLDMEVVVGPSSVAGGDTMLVVRDVSQRRRELMAHKAQQRQLEFLVELFKQSENFDESAIVRRLIDQANDLTGSPLAYLYFVNPEEKTIQLAAWRDRTQSHATMPNSEARQLAKANLFTECVRAKRPTSSNDLTRKPQPDGLPDLQRYLAVPMVSDEETVAILGVANRDAGYSEEDQRHLAGLAEGVWRVLQAKRAHAQTLGSLQRTDVALQAMIDSFVRVIERHDPHTAGSSRRLAALAVALAREAGLDGERQHGLRIAALLHDIGNIAVPASILAKPAPLTETELAVMRTHVEEGCQLLAEVDFGAPVADIVYQSHERCDGSGYPSGLKGEEIMLEARILAIADTVEAMCSARPYRAAAGMEAAIEEINRGAGRLYDLRLVAACTRLVRQHGFVLPE